MKDSSLNFHQQYTDLLIANLRLLIPIGVLFVTGFSYIDYKQNSVFELKVYFLVRLISCLPMIIFFFNVKRLRWCIEGFSILSFCSVVAGASYTSYLIGGLTSDYYIVILIISFIQLSFFPLNIFKTALSEIFYIMIFFPINIIPFEIDYAIVLKQFVNYLSFSTLKLIAARKAHTMLELVFAKHTLEKEMESKDKIQDIFAELCHLINNPLFISQNLTKRAINSAPISEKTIVDLNNSLIAQKRIQKVVQRLNELYDNKNIDLEEYQFLLDQTRAEIEKIT